MKKHLIFFMAGILTVGSAFATTTPATSESSFIIDGKKKNKKPVSPAESERTFHVTKCEGGKKAFIMIGKKADTKVTVKVYNKNGTLVYKDIVKADRDFSTLLNLENIEEPLIKVSDSSGIEKEYTL